MNSSQDNPAAEPVDGEHDRAAMVPAGGDHDPAAMVPAGGGHEAPATLATVSAHDQTLALPSVGGQDETVALAPGSGHEPAAEPAMSGITVELALLSRRGGRERNEDACGHWNSEDWLCCVLADGAGGHGGGDVASRTAVQYMIECFSRRPLATPIEVEAQLRATNQEVIRHRADGEDLRDMHTTAVLLAVDLRNQTALWGHVGDSRLYLFRAGALFERTIDHSLVQQMHEAGMIEAWEMRTHPQRSALYSALGAPPQDITISSRPQPCAILPGDVLLLCTDGLWEYVEDEMLCASLAASASAAAWLASLEAMVLANAASANKLRHDNFSAVAVWFGAT